MSEMIELVAKAMWDVRRKMAMDVHGVELEGWGDGSIPRSNHVFEEARAAIEAMRNPTEEMKEAYYRFDERFSPHPAEDCWDNMIDEALK